MIDKRKVYRFKMTGNTDYTSLALDCQMHQRDGEDWRELWYFDTIRPHMIEGEIVKETEDGFVFRSDGYEPGEWDFKELTIEDFRRKYYKQVEMGEAIAAKITTTADLHEWYRKQYSM